MKDILIVEIEDHLEVIMSELSDILDKLDTLHQQEEIEDIHEEEMNDDEFYEFLQTQVRMMDKCHGV